MEGEFRNTLQEKLVTGLVAEVPALTRREVRLPAIPGKALAVIGMRRSGKTSFLWQCLGDLLAAGAPRESLVYLNFEDERLAGLDASALSFVLEEYFRLYPGFRDREPVTFFLDEIQLVGGWERFARRLLDSEKVRLFLSGSSASMLSREVATSMRGRALEVTIYPFSFRETLAHRGILPERNWGLLPKRTRSELEAAFLEYLRHGGFPEAQGADPRDRRALLQSYVDVAVLRDVIERHAIANPVALRWLQRHLMSNPAAPFSIQKFYDSLKSQGLPVSKDSLHSFLAYFEDAFLVRTTSMLSASERQRMVNPRKAYSIDPGLIAIYERTGRANLGHALETAVFIELQRRGYDVHYLRTSAGYEVDFHAIDAEGRTLLVQVCANAGVPNTFAREVRALLDAHNHHPTAHPLLILLDSHTVPDTVPDQLQVVGAVEWMIQGSDAG